MYVKYVGNTTDELTNGNIYYVINMTPFSVLCGITIINNLDEKDYLLYDANFIEVTKEYARNKTISHILD